MTWRAASARPCAEPEPETVEPEAVEVKPKTAKPKVVKAKTKAVEAGAEAADAEPYDAADTEAVEAKPQAVVAEVVEAETEAVAAEPEAVEPEVVETKPEAVEPEPEAVEPEPSTAVAEVELGRYCQSRHPPRLRPSSLDSKHHMTWRVLSARPWAKVEREAAEPKPHAAGKYMKPKSNKVEDNQLTAEFAGHYAENNVIMVTW